MAVQRRRKHEAIKGLEGKSRRDFVFYLNLLSINGQTFTTTAASPDACRQEVINYLTRHTDSDRDGKINWLNSCRNLNLLPDEHFDWIETDERACCWAWGWLMRTYLSEPSSNTGVGNQHPPANAFQNSFVTFPTSSKERFHSIVYFFDTRSANLENKKKLIEDMKLEWMSVLTNPHPLKFIDPTNEQQCDWAWEYLQKHGASMSIYSPINNKEKYLSAVASMDLSDVHRDTKKIFLINMKKACDQKKYREKLKDKKPLNTFINEDSKQRLDWLAKQRGQNINKTIEWLIDKEYYSHI